MKIIAWLKEKPTLLQLFSYLIVGGIATAVEWVIFYFLTNLTSINYLFATAIAYVISTAANWGAGRMLTFRNSEKQPIFRELLKIYSVSIVGLALNELLMYIFVQLLVLPEMPSKMACTVIVFAWNFLSRKFWIYRQKRSNDKQA